VLSGRWTAAVRARVQPHKEQSWGPLEQTIPQGVAYGQVSAVLPGSTFVDWFYLHRAPPLGVFLLQMRTPEAPPPKGGEPSGC
jgi:hypothetical protein